YDDFPAFQASRRAVRVFKKEPVDRALVNKVIEAASMAPMGFPPHTTEILVIDRREELDHLLEVVRSNYDKLVKMWANPVMRGVIRLKRGARIAHSLRTHVMSIVQDNNERFRLSGEDRYTYSAPVLMLFHANQWAVSFEENAMLVASYAMLGAHALGLGATLLSIIPPAVNNFKDLRLRYDMPDDNVVVTSMILGYPKYKYRLGVRRRLRNVKFV
ncbi:MAG: nitroreductase family protein, partial [Syntrophales bacterium LBB04]|nr:nitroreductase family protein [Syntrophales bacterium LBB04]